MSFKDPSIKTLFIMESYFYKYKPYFATKIELDSANVHNDTYLFEGTTLYPTAIRLRTFDRAIKFNKLIFIDTGYQEIHILKKDSSYVIKANTSIEREHRKFLHEMNIKTLDDKISGRKLLSYVRKKPNSYVALFAIINQAFWYLYPTIFSKINDAFGEKIKQTTAFQYYLNSYAPNNIGVSAPDFSLTSIDGKKVTLSSFKNKNIVLLDFWASWCGPCLRMAPHLKDLYKKYHSKGLEIISISTDTDSNLWIEGVKESGIDSWFNIRNKDYHPKNNLSSGIDIKYGVEKIPTTILINRKGNIIGRFIGFENDTSKSDLDKKLIEVLK